MVGRKSGATIVAAVLFAGCATAPSTLTGDDEAPPEVERITSSSVRIERRGRLPAVAHVERQCDVGEVQRVIDLLGAAGAGRVTLKVEGGPQAEVLTRLSASKGGRWLVVALTDSGFKLFFTSAENLSKKGRAKVPEGPETSDVPLHEGQPDWERLNNLIKVLGSRQPNLAGVSVAAPAAGGADRAIEALEQVRLALPDSPRRYLLSL